MKCSKCGGDNRVVTTAKDDQRVYRLRECNICGNRWHTEEYENNSSRVALAVYRIKGKKYKNKGGYKNEI